MEETRKKLLARLEELEAVMESSSDSRKPVELDQSRVGRLSRMDALQVQAMALASDKRRQQEILKIKSALARIDEDEYGYCVVCGEEIEPRRLNADPAIPTCIACASKK